MATPLFAGLAGAGSSLAQGLLAARQAKAAQIQQDIENKKAADQLELQRQQLAEQTAARKQGLSPDIQTFRALVDAGVAPIDALKQVTQATQVAPNLQRGVFVGPDGKSPVVGFIEPKTGVVTDSVGNVMVNPTPWESNQHSVKTPTLDQQALDAEKILKDPSASASDLASANATLAAIKAVQTLKSDKPMSGYEVGRLLSLITDGYRYNPDLLPALAGEFQAMGLPMTPGFSQAVGEVPQGQPTSPETGQPIGLAQPEAPTGTTRSRGQFAAATNLAIDRALLALQDPSIQDKLGAIGGRWNEFRLGTVGADDPSLAGLRSTLQNIATAWMRLHANSEDARQDFEKTLRLAQSPADLATVLQTIKMMADDYVREGSGQVPNVSPSPNNKPPSSGGSPFPAGTIFPGGGR